MELNELRKTAEKANSVLPESWMVMGDSNTVSVVELSKRDGSIISGGAVADAHTTPFRDHIATFDPPTVLALLSRLEQAEQAVDDLRGKYDEAETARIDGDAQLDRVRELHSYGKLIYPNGDEEHYCTYDENAWPCETIRALDGDGRG